MSTQELKVNKISPNTATDFTIGETGDTVTVPSGVAVDISSATVNLPATTSVATEFKTNKVSPASGTAFTLGDSGDTFTIPSGVTFTNSGTATGFGAGPSLISTQTASGSSSIEFTSGLDSTYYVYMFKFFDINSDQTNASFMFNGASVAGDSGNNQTKTTTVYYAQHNESGANNELAYYTARDLAQSTNDQYLAYNVDGAADSAFTGELCLFAPSNAYYVKHFYGTFVYMQYDVSSTYLSNYYVSGYFNTTNVIDKIIFMMDTGNFSGVIQMWGL